VQHAFLGGPHDRHLRLHYSNFLPFVPPEAVALHNDFERALYASL
jgi:hypothetical protein